VNRSIATLAHSSVAFLTVNDARSDFAACAHDMIKGYHGVLVLSNESLPFDLKHKLLEVVVMGDLVTVLAQRLLTAFTEEHSSSNTALLTTHHRVFIEIDL
jgi:hypothetical protein